MDLMAPTNLYHWDQMVLEHYCLLLLDQMDLVILARENRVVLVVLVGPMDKDYKEGVGGYNHVPIDFYNHLKFLYSYYSFIVYIVCIY
jgi:hypothetical protein